MLIRSNNIIRILLLLVLVIRLERERGRKYAYLAVYLYGNTLRYPAPQLPQLRQAESRSKSCVAVCSLSLSSR